MLRDIWKGKITNQPNTAMIIFSVRPNGNNQNTVGGIQNRTLPQVQ